MNINETATTNNIHELIEDVNEFIQVRLAKLNELRVSGIEPYPYSYNPTAHSTEIIQAFETYTEDQIVRVAGRIMLLRNMGSITFLDLHDEKGKIQIYFNKKLLGEEAYRLLRKFDVGDILGVEGSLFKTKTGEITIKAVQYTLLSKAIRPIPEKYHGLVDADLRQRHRSLDMIMNPEVKEVFIKRSKGISALREFLNARGFIEVEVPVLDTKYGGGEAKPFITTVNALDCDVYMKVSPELYLKRLVVGGMERVYTIDKSFRNEGIDRTHYPEFTLFECYMAYADYRDMMNLTETLYEYVFTKVNGSTVINYDGIEIDFKAPWRRLTMYEAVKECTSIEVATLSKEEIISEMKERNIVLLEVNSDVLPKGELVLELFDAFCPKHLIQPIFIIDFPMESSPLCKLHRNNPELIERFEPYANGVELGNAYSELNDPIRQRMLLKDQASKLRAGLETASPMDEEFAVAIDVGMPPTGGLGLGIDRLIMFLTNSYTIKDVIAFPLVKR